MFARSFRSSKTFITFVMCVAIFTDMLSAGIIVPMLPYALSERMGLPAKDVQRWNSILLASYGGALMIGSLIFGWIGDRVSSRQTPFIFGLAVLGASTLSFALGSTLHVLLIARMLQGLSSAIVFTVGSALLFDTVGKERIGRAMGYTSISLSLGLLLGPVIGGILYKYGGYFQVFLPALGLLIVDVILRLMVITGKRIPFKPGPQEFSKQTLPQTEVDGQSYGTYSTRPIQTGKNNIPADKQTGIPSNRSSHLNTETEPLLPAASPKVVSSAYSILLCSPRFLVAIMSLFILNSFTTGFDGVLPVYVHDAFDFNSMQVAFLFLFLSVPLVLAPISGALTDRYGAKWPATGGLVLIIPSLILLRLIDRNATSPALKLAGLLFSVGLALAIALTPLMTEVSSVVEELERETPGIFGPHGAYSQAYGLMNTAFAAGSLVGPLYAGFIRDWLGWSAMSLFMGILSSIMLVFVMVMTGGYRYGVGKIALNLGKGVSYENV